MRTADTLEPCMCGTRIRMCEVYAQWMYTRKMFVQQVSVCVQIRFVINMMALDDVPDIPRDTRRLCRNQRETNPRATHAGRTGALLAKR